MDGTPPPPEIVSLILNMGLGNDTSTLTQLTMNGDVQVMGSAGSDYLAFLRRM